MASCPPPGPLSPPTGVPTVDFLNGKLKMLITDLWNTREGWNPSSWTRVYDTTDAGKAIEARLYKRSKEMFSMLANNPLTEVLKIHGGATWGLEAEGFRVKKEPKPGETVNQYRARGGYFLYKKMFTGDYPIQHVTPSWVGKHDPIDGFYLNIRVKRWTAANTVPPHTIRPRPDLIGRAFFQIQGTINYPGKLDKAMDWVVHFVQKLCNKLTGDKMQKAAMVLLMAGTAWAETPVGAAALAAAGVYQAIAAACGLAWPTCALPPAPPVVTTPLPSVPLPTNVIPLPSVWYRRPTTWAAAGAVVLGIGVTALAFRPRH